VVVDRQDMSLAGLDPHTMSVSSKAGGVVFGLYFALCAFAALLVAARDRSPSGFWRVLLVSAAVVHGLLGAFTVGLVGWGAFAFMMVVLGLILFTLMTYDGQGGPVGTPPAGTGPEGGGPEGGGPGGGEAARGEPQDGTSAERETPEPSKAPEPPKALKPPTAPGSDGPAPVTS